MMINRSTTVIIFTVITVKAGALIVIRITITIATGIGGITAILTFIFINILTGGMIIMCMTTGITGIITSTTMTEMEFIIPDPKKAVYM